MFLTHRRCFELKNKVSKLHENGNYCRSFLFCRVFVVRLQSSNSAKLRQQWSLLFAPNQANAHFDHHNAIADLFFCPTGPTRNHCKSMHMGYQLYNFKYFNAFTSMKDTETSTAYLSQLAMSAKSLLAARGTIPQVFSSSKF